MDFKKVLNNSTNWCYNNPITWGYSSVGQSASLTSKRSPVRTQIVPPCIHGPPDGGLFSFPKAGRDYSLIDYLEIVRSEKLEVRSGGRGAQLIKRPNTLLYKMRNNACKGYYFLIASVKHFLLPQVTRL